MPDFNYRGILRNGKTVRGTIVAKNRKEAIKKLKLSRIQPIRIVPKKKVAISKSKIDNKRLQTIQQDVEKNQTAKTKRNKTKTTFASVLFSDIGVGITPKDVLTFTNSLYILKKAGFNNIDAFESLYNTLENPKLKDVIDDILIGIEGGSSIHELMKGYPKVFPPIYINFVKVGEESGALDKALLYARDYMENNTKLRKQIRGILMPKIMLFVFALILTIVGLLWGTPLIQNVYDMFGSTKALPQATQIAVKVSEWVLEYWYIVISVLLGIAAIVFSYVKTPMGRYQLDKLKIKFPVFGRLSLNIIVNKFFQAMLLNIKNGMRIQEALDVSKAVTDNYYFLSLIEIGKNNLLSGGSWIEPFEAEKALPSIVIQMVNTGMKTDLAEMMEKVNEYVNQEINETIEKTVKALPEIMYIFIGAILILFVITIMVPLLDVYMGTFLFE